MRTPVIHELKIDDHFVTMIREGKKRHEVRKADRDYSCGDFLFLKSINDGVAVAVTHITPSGARGLPEDLCVMSIKPINPE